MVLLGSFSETADLELWQNIGKGSIISQSSSQLSHPQLVMFANQIKREDPDEAFDVEMCNLKTYLTPNGLMELVAQ